MEIFGSVLDALFRFLFVCMIIAILGLGYFLYTILWPRGKRIESKELLVPEMRLTTDGKKVDTIYIYRKP